MGKKGDSKKGENKQTRDSVVKYAVIISAIISSVFSLITGIYTNNRLKEIESQKYEYSLHQIKYEKLQESLIYFSKFKVYDDKFISRIDVDSENYSALALQDMKDDSFNEFLAQIQLLYPYLSDASLEHLNTIYIPDKLILHDIDFEGLTGVDDLNNKIKEHCRITNDNFYKYSDAIVAVIQAEIQVSYVP